MCKKKSLSALCLAICLGMIADAITAAKPQPDIWETIDQEVNQPQDADDAVFERVYCSKELERYVKSSLDGRWEDSDKEWVKLLKTLSPCRSIEPVISLVYKRVVFRNDESKGLSANPMPLFTHMLNVTKNNLGNTHRFVGDVYDGIAFQWEGQRDYGQATEYRRKQLAIAESYFGKNHRRAISTRFQLAEDLLASKKYQEAEALIKAQLAVAESHRNGHDIRMSVKLFEKLLKETGRDKEAAALHNKYLK